MENNKISYSSQTYNAIKAFLYAFPVYALFVGLIIIISRYLHQPLIAVFGWIGISSMPFLFQKKFKSLFTRTVLLEFDNQSFSTKEYTIKDDVLVKEITISWVEIKSYKCYFSTSNVTFLVIYLRDGSSKSFSFKDEKNQEQAINEKSVFSIFYYFIKQHGKEIYFKPPFLTTKKGSFVLYGVVILAIVAIILHIVLQPNTSMFSFMSLFIILGLIVKRKTDKALYNKISHLEPRSPFS